VSVKKAFIMVFSLASLTAAAQSPVTTITLGSDQIATLKTAPSITTRIAFPDTVREIICGDLYDPQTGKGTFVVQRGGTDQNPSNDVFIKPVAPKGVSNLFVKTGERGENVYSFDLVVVPPAQAYRQVNIVSQRPADRKPPGNPNPDAARAELEQARKQAEEILRNARQQADRIVAEAEAKASEAEQQLAQRAEQEAERRFVSALMLGLRETKVSNRRAAAKKVTITLDPRLLTFGEKSYLRYTIQNNSNEDFTFSTVSLEATSDGGSKPITIEVVQSKSEKRVTPGESLTGVIIFDPKQLGPNDKLTLYVRDESNTEISHVVIKE
jgi:vacuolar-type H+-ATPase subunit H